MNTLQLYSRIVLRCDARYLELCLVGCTYVATVIDAEDIKAVRCYLCLENVTKTPYKDEQATGSDVQPHLLEWIAIFTLLPSFIEYRMNLQSLTSLSLNSSFYWFANSSSFSSSPLLFWSILLKTHVNGNRWIQQIRVECARCHEQHQNEALRCIVMLCDATRSARCEPALLHEWNQLMIPMHWSMQSNSFHDNEKTDMDAHKSSLSTAIYHQACENPEMPNQADMSQSRNRQNYASTWLWELHVG